MSARPEHWLTSEETDKLREVKARRPDAISYRHVEEQLARHVGRPVVVIERRARACRDLSRWLALGWLLLVGLLGLIERREAR